MVKNLNNYLQTLLLYLVYETKTNGVYEDFYKNKDLFDVI